MIQNNWSFILDVYTIYWSYSNIQNNRSFILDVYTIYWSYSNGQNRFRRLAGMYTLSSLGTDVWPAIENIYTNLALLYIYSFFPISKKGLFCQFSFFTLRHVPQRGKPYKSPFCSCSRRFNGADVRTVHSRKFICWVHCVRSLIGIIILLHQLHLLYLIFQDWFLYSTLIIVVFLNVCTAIFQGGIIGKKGTDTYLIDLYVLLTSVSDPYHLVGSGSVSGNVDMDPGSAKN